LGVCFVLQQMVPPRFHRKVLPLTSTSSEDGRSKIFRN
jgi:hypothetical protein